MTRIKILPESVKNKIAAGEVVEGPFSVVKELIENSIDAEATEIDIEVFESGLKKILVKDNGKGIYKDDLALAVQNHATSKIENIPDIEKIASYGFRGEALAGISSISKFTMFSRSIEESLGAKIIHNDGHSEITDYAGDPGTTTIVENLFYNIPARKKFLKAKSTELRKIREVFLKTAMVNPDIDFSLNVDGKRSITLVKAAGLEERVGQIYGKSVPDSLYFDRLKDLKTEICGFLSKPDFLKSSRSMQILFVNNRPVEYKYLGFLLSKAYEAIAPRGSYPAAVIFIDIDPALIDVNIHPAKKEIKFFDQNYINSLILHLADKALGKAHNLNLSRMSAGRITDKIKTQNIKTDPSGPAHVYEEQLEFKDRINNINRSGFSENNSDKSNMFNSTISDYPFSSFIREAGKLYDEFDKQYDFKFLGIIFNTYIVIEKDNVLSFIDFHAAHERYIYDTMNNETKPETQALIFPQVMELPVEDYQIFLEKKDYFVDTSFDIDIFSDNAIVVRGIPGIVKDLNIEGFISDIIEAFKREGDHVRDVKKIIAEKAACHSAKRSGDSLSPEEAKIIASRALNGEYDKRCPHGRPYIYQLEKKDLEKVFKRI